MKKGQTVYLIDVHGVDVLEREFLRDDDVFVYARYKGESGRGSSHRTALNRRKTNEMPLSRNT